MTDDGKILEAASDRISQRAESHGEPEDSFATIAAMWNQYLRVGGIADPNITPEDVAYMMVLLKVARSAHAPEPYMREDNDVDIAGYAECAARTREKPDNGV